ncbi:MAG: YggS family pyridoxal phosphate-dependent enzyme, partial [Firmicutes bacterium]|nr:YggS family pyridoxal phosphate-dependent enzyme [Bacillota bacterium]
MSIKENIIKVTEIKNKAAEKAGRSGDDVLLCAVTKTHGADMINEAIDAGITDIGENKVQEIMDKYDKLPVDIRWHMIGHLQTNKVKYIADKVYMIHSVESEKLAKEINKQALKVGRVIPILIEVNIAGEESKFGVAPSECEQLIRSIHSLPGIAVKGLMAVPPFVLNAE